MHRFGCVHVVAFPTRMLYVFMHRECIYSSSCILYKLNSDQSWQLVLNLFKVSRKAFKQRTHSVTASRSRSSTSLLAKETRRKRGDAPVILTCADLTNDQLSQLVTPSTRTVRQRLSNAGSKRLTGLTHCSSPHPSRHQPQSPIRIGYSMPQPPLFLLQSLCPSR
jgi:hypothetical protein